MSENNDSLPKIENMLEKLIEEDEDFDKNDENNEVKFTQEISDLDEEKFFEKDFFINPPFQSEDNNSNLDNSKINSLNKIQSNPFQIKPNKITRFENNIPNIPNINNNLYNNSLNSTLFYNTFFPHQINNSLCNSYNLKNPSNSNINSNSTTFFSSNYDTNIYNQNFNTSYICSNNNYNFKENSLINNGNQDFNNSFYAGDKSCFNQNNRNSNLLFTNNIIINSNVEFEILLIETKKILNKIEKIDSGIYNKLKGKFEQIVRTHKGSRIFQNYLKNTHADILHQIFLELKNKLTELLKDNYANYFCKKLFSCLNQKDRIEYLNIIQNDLSSLAIDYIATYPIQAIIEQLGSKAEKTIIYMGIKDSLNIYCYNIYGAHILEKILSYFEDEFIKEIIDYVYNNFIDLSYHNNGICIVKKLLLMTHKKDLHNKIKKIIYDNALNLIVHQYGNYVIQTIVEDWDDNDLEDIIEIYRNKFIYLSKQKYASNAIERIIEKNKKNLEIYIDAICNENNFIEIIKNKYGNYVIQKAVKISSGYYKEKIIRKISKNINKIEDKKIINKWKSLISCKYYV